MTDQQRLDAIDKANAIAVNLTAGLKADGSLEDAPAPPPSS